MVNLLQPVNTADVFSFVDKLTAMRDSSDEVSPDHRHCQSLGLVVLSQNVRQLLATLSYSPSSVQELAPCLATASDEMLNKLTERLERHWAYKLSERQAYYAAAASGLSTGLLIQLTPFNSITLISPSIPTLVLVAFFLIFMTVFRITIARTGILSIKRDLETLGDLSLLNILMTQELRKNGPATQYIAQVNGKCKRKLRVIDAKIALALNGRPIRRMRPVKKRDVLKKMLGRGPAVFGED